MTIEELRADLESKHDRKVKQVRVTTIIAALQEIEDGDPVIRKGVERLRELESIKSELAAARADMAQLEARVAAKPRVTKRDIIDSLTAGRAMGMLLGTAEVAALLGVERPRVGKWRALGRIPEPLEDLKATPVWLREQIEPLVAEAHAGRRGERRLDAESELETAV